MPIKLLIVDDSALMRQQLSRIFTTAGDFEIRTARNGVEAVAENIEWEPDVITLDINMPEMDGLTALSQIMASRPVPVIMLSSLTEKGALATFESLALGAVDYVAKPDGTISLSIAAVKNELLTKVRAALCAKPKFSSLIVTQKHPEKRQSKKSVTHSATSLVPEELPGLVIIGTSTGGPSALEAVLTPLPADYRFPIIVAQHMPAAFTGPFAQRLNQLCALQIIEVTHPMQVEPGVVFIGRGGADIVVSTRANKLMVLPRPESSHHLWHPSVDVLARSVLEHYDPRRVIAVMLTGMGHDGAEAFAEIKSRSGRTIAESEETAVVYGMPRELIELGGATTVLPLPQIANQLIRWTYCN